MQHFFDAAFESRVTDRLRHAIELSWDFAARTNSERFDTRHLLFGLFAKASGVAYHILNKFGVTERTLESLCNSSVGLEKPKIQRILDVDTEVRTAIDETVNSARSFNHNYYGTEHLLIGLTVDGLTSFVIMKNLGLDPYSVRTKVLALLGHFPEIKQ